MWTSALSWICSWRSNTIKKTKPKTIGYVPFIIQYDKICFSPLTFFFFKLINLFLSVLRKDAGAFLSLQRVGLLSSCCAQWCGFSSFRARAIGLVGLRSCHTRAQQLQLPGTRAQAQLWRGMGLVALRHVESSQTRDWTCVSCIGRWSLYHGTTRDAP